MKKRSFTKNALLILAIFELISCRHRMTYDSSMKGVTLGSLYTWDNWLAGPVNVNTNGRRFKGMGRFSLEAPRVKHGHPVAPNERHGMAQVGFYVETKADTWTRVATAVDVMPTWSGSAFTCKDCPFDTSGPKIKTGESSLPRSVSHVTTDEQMYLFYTERTDVPEKWGQRLVMGYYDNLKGEFYKMTKPILDPQANTGLMQRLGYDIKSNEIISAWRDPTIFKAEDGKIHMFFAARFNEDFYNANLKTLQPGGFNPRRNSTVGHALFNPGSKSWDIQKPMALSQSAVQFELPQFVRKNGKIHMFLTKADWDVTTPENAANEVNRRHSLLGFSADAIDGKWAPLKGTDGTIAMTDNFYGVTFKEANGKVYISAFMEADVSMANTMEVDFSRGTADLEEKMSKFSNAEIRDAPVCLK